MHSVQNAYDRTHFGRICKRRQIENFAVEQSFAFSSEVFEATTVSEYLSIYNLWIYIFLVLVNLAESTNDFYRFQRLQLIAMLFTAIYIQCTPIFIEPTVYHTDLTKSWNRGNCASLPGISHMPVKTNKRRFVFWVSVNLQVISFL